MREVSPNQHKWRDAELGQEGLDAGVVNPCVLNTYIGVVGLVVGGGIMVV